MKNTTSDARNARKRCCAALNSCRSRARSALRSSWFRPVAIAACGLLAIGLGINSYQSTTRNHGKGVQMVAASAVLNTDRSPEDGALPANKSLRLKFTVPPGNFKAYRSVIVGPDTVERR